MPQGLKDLLLGEMALRHQLLSEEQLDLCIQQQIDERYGRPLGRILVEKGFLQEDVLEALLRTQRRAMEEFEKNAEYGQLFGKTAVLKGFVTEEKLAQAIRAQARKHARGVKAKLGQVMIELGLLSIAQFWEIIHQQGDFTCGNCRQRIDRPIFRGNAILCQSCKSPAFEVTADSPGPKPRRRTLRRKS